MNPYLYIVVIVFKDNMERSDRYTNIACGVVMLVALITLSYIHAFGHVAEYLGVFPYFVQLIAFTIASGCLTTELVHAILDKVSPWFRYWVQQKTMKRILIIIFAFEFAMVFAFGLDLMFRTIVVWIFVPVYQILSKLRNIPIAETNDERMKYIPEDGEI